MKPNIFIPLCALALLFSGLGNICCETVTVNSTDVLSLLDFKQAIANDPENFLINWNKSTNLCQWNGVQCNPKHPGRVTGLNLLGQGLSGVIAASVGNLTALRTLDLSNNHLSGIIPPLNNLHKLEILNLSTNSLEGNIPDIPTNASNLLSLDLSRNMLVGVIPLEIDLLTSLKNFILANNNFTGNIPPTLGNITNLKVMILSNNHLEGAIPVELGSLSNLSWLSMAANNLSGGIPQSLYNLTSLSMLSLRSNTLGKALAPNIGETLPNLTRLYLEYNMFEGHIPASLGNASGIIKIDLSGNKFSGRVPRSFGNLNGLSFLNLDKNKLEASDSESWGFIDALSNCRSLQLLSLAENQFTGPIPDSIGNLSISLQTLAMGGNNLSGIVPRSMGNLSMLNSLTLDSNNLTGTVPEWIVKLKNLEALYLQDNNFNGPIPPSIGNLTQLTLLYLQNNNFEGPIPPGLGSLSQISELDISYNHLQSNIPPQISMLGQLYTLILSSNKLTGEIPDTLSRCQNLVTISMDNNFFIGSIPTSLGNITGLTILNLSHNNLSGTIPTSLSNLQLLKSLDLSYNHLHGKIPEHGVFANATSVSLDNNWGLCGGTMDLGMPSCQSPTSSRRNNRRYYLVEILIPIFGFLSLALLVYFLVLEKKSPRRKSSENSSFGDSFIKVSYNDLAQATGDFSESNIIGKGSHGSVYRGKLKESKFGVAVKVFNLEMQDAERSFMSECEALRSIQHRNLLPIITACSTVDSTGNVFKALVYEFMPNGSLDTWLHQKGDSKTPNCLGLNQRISIAVNIADALDYLHHDCGRPTVHCDLKPSNILLNDDMTALLGDFGIARFYVDSQSMTTGSISSAGVRGTIGYIAPEYGRGGHASTCGDVYSFGIVLLEMITGKRPTDPMFKDGLDIITFVSSNLPDQACHAIDAHLLEEGKKYDQEGAAAENEFYQCLVSLLELALSCTRPLPCERMDMKEIASKLHEIKTTCLEWKKKKHASSLM